MTILKQTQDSKGKKPRQDKREKVKEEIRKALKVKPFTSGDLKHEIVETKGIVSGKTYYEYLKEEGETWREEFLDSIGGPKDKRVTWHFIKGSKVRWKERSNVLIYEGSVDDVSDTVETAEQAQRELMRSLVAYRRYEVQRFHADSIRQGLQAWLSLIDDMTGLSYERNRKTFSRPLAGPPSPVGYNPVTWAMYYPLFAEFDKCPAIADWIHIIEDFSGNHLKKSVEQLNVDFNPLELYDRIAEALRDMQAIVAEVYSLSNQLCYAWKDGVLKGKVPAAEFFGLVSQRALGKFILLWQNEVERSFKGKPETDTPEFTLFWYFKGGVDKSLDPLPFTRPHETNLYELQGLRLNWGSEDTTLSSDRVLARRIAKLGGDTESDVDALAQDLTSFIDSSPALLTCMELIGNWSQKFRDMQEITRKFKAAIQGFISLPTYPGICYATAEVT